VRGIGRGTWIGAAAIAVALGAAGPASAATLYAGPAGTNTGTCPQSDPCSVATAIANSTPADDVAVLPGNYALANDAQFDNTGKSRNIHGTSRRDKPRLTSGINGGGGIFYLVDGTSFRDIDITLTASHPAGAVAITDTGPTPHLTLEGLAIRGGSGGNFKGISVSGPTTVRDTSIQIGGTSAVGIVTFADLQLRNVTVVTRGASSDAVRVNATASPAALTALSVIARGGANDFNLAEGGSPATANVSYSNYHTVTSTTPSHFVGSPTNQTTVDPVFVDEPAGNLHQAAGSPTIDAGATDSSSGTLDVDGDLRTIHDRVDIGADEMPVTTAATGDASGVGEGAATIAGVVNPGGTDGSYHFEYGTTTGYGASTAAGSFSSGTADQPVSASLTGLAPGTTYHYRLVATNAVGSTNGADRTFTTSASPVAPVPSVFEGLLMDGGYVRMSRTGVIKLRLSCLKDVPVACANGRVVLTSKSPLKGTKSRKVGSSAIATLPKDTQKIVKVKLTRRARAVVLGRGSLKIRGSVRATSAGQVKTTHRTLRILRRR
jgi:hypothetical protein